MRVEDWWTTVTIVYWGVFLPLPHKLEELHDVLVTWCANLDSTHILLAFICPVWLLSMTVAVTMYLSSFNPTTVNAGASVQEVRVHQVPSITHMWCPVMVVGLITFLGSHCLFCSTCLTVYRIMHQKHWFLLRYHYWAMKTNRQDLRDGRSVPSTMPKLLPLHSTSCGHVAGQLLFAKSAWIYPEYLRVWAAARNGKSEATLFSLLSFFLFIYHLDE